MLKEIADIEAATDSKSYAEFEEDWLLHRAVQRALVIVSEASRRIPPEIKAQYPAIRWSNIAGIGNVLRHNYHEISNEVIWKVIQDELPILKTALESIMATLER